MRTISTPYGQGVDIGGHGSPLKRDHEVVEEDLNQGKATTNHARQHYGVVFDVENRAELKAAEACWALLRGQPGTGAAR